MKKLVVLMLVLGLVASVNATVIDIVKVGVGSLGHAGTIEDPLVESETIGLKIVLNANAHPLYASYDGYALSSMDLDLHVIGAGTISIPVMLDGTIKAANRNAGLSPWTNTAVTGAGVDRMMGVALTPIQGPADLVWNFTFHCEGAGNVLIDLTLNGLTEYSDYAYPAEWKAATEMDLGDLIIYQVPEPMTVALLGLGGLFLRRRK